GRGTHDFQRAPLSPARQPRLGPGLGGVALVYPAAARPMSERLRDYCPQLREDQAQPAATPQYAGLPLAVRLVFTGHEWAWMSDQRKALLLQQECEPEWTE